MDAASRVGRGAARRHPARLHALCVACAHAPGVVALALSRRASRGLGPRCFHRPAVPLRGTGSLGCLACGPDPPHWRLPAGVIRVADGSVALDPVSSLKRAARGGDRAAAQPLYRHPAHARDPSLDRPGETNSNWSSGLTLWDRVHGTLRLNVPQEEITIGVPAYRESEEATLPKLLAMPF